MNNDIVTKARLNAALGTEGNMGFEHNDIVTVDKMNEAIAEGGGGSSDFSTAQVTIVDNIGDGINLELPVLYEEGEVEEGAPAYVSAISMSYTSGVYNVVLYKGNLLLILSQEQGVTTSGSITKLQSSAYLISGDCTITISQ